MKKLNIISKLKSYVAYGVAGLAVVGLGACNKDFNFRLNFDEKPDDTEIQATSYKVAYLVVEGGVGSIISQEARDIGAMPTLGRLTTNAMVSWNGVSAENKQSLTSYADLLTGVEYAKHQTAGDGSGNQIDEYPTLFKRIADNSNLRTALISSNTGIGAIVETADIDNYSVEADDVAVTNKTVEELNRTDAGLIMATFKGVGAAGQASGYDSEAYKQALSAFDGQLKTIVDAIQARKDYAMERWLIIVTSDKGGEYTLPAGQDDGSIFSDTERNNFVVVHNSQFAFQQYERMQTVDPAWTSSAVRYTGNQGRGIITAENADIYNIDISKEYTIQFKVKIHAFGNDYPVLIAKRQQITTSLPGWGCRIEKSGSENILRFNAVNKAVTSDYLELETWYTVAARIFREGGSTYLNLYVNGIPGTPVELTEPEMGINDQPLRLGSLTTAVGSPSYTIADVRIYNTAKSDIDLKNTYCTTMSTPGTDDYYDNLIGYWPGDDGGTELRDRSGSNRHFDMVGNYSWNSFSERGGTICPTLPDNIERYVIRSVDMPRMIYSWLNFMNVDEFNLDSQIWNPVFTNP